MPKRTPVSEFEKRLTPGDISNPFAKWASEHEPRLKEFFVRGPLFGVLFRDQEQPETRFIFGSPGSGKTAYRRMMERRYRPQHRRSPILAANYFDSPVLDLAAHAAPDAASHWWMLERATLLALVRELLVDPEPFFALFASSRAQLVGYFQKLFPTHQPFTLVNWLRAQDYPTLADAIEAQDAQYAAGMLKQWDMLEALRAEPTAALPRQDTQELYALLMLVERCGLTHACIFVDGVDKFVERGRTQDALNLILPLCHSLQTLDEMHLAVQFFLPQDLATPLLDRGVRYDRFKRYDLNWTDGQLTELLRQRLETVSDNKISSLGQLAEEQTSQPEKNSSSPKASVSKKEQKANSTTEGTTTKKPPEPLSQRLDRDLVMHAHGSPRQLVRLATGLFDAYHARAPREGLFIQQDLETAIAAEKGTLRRDSIVPPLVIDAKLGRVSVGEREVPNLSAKELACLILLQQADGETLSRKEIWSKLYPNEPEPSQAQTDPFFSRLRGKLERNSKDPVYLITDWGRGFHLENVAD